MDQVALAHPSRKQRAPHAERVVAARHRFEYRARRREHVRVVLDRAGDHAAERRRFGLQCHQLGLSDNGQRRKRVPVRHRIGVDPVEQAGDGRGAHRGAKVVAQGCKLLRHARLRDARFERVVMPGDHVCEERRCGGNSGMPKRPPCFMTAGGVAATRATACAGGNAWCRGSSCARLRPCRGRTPSRPRCRRVR